jgi:TonB-linked SusC/RagA family outer membrane protein
MCCLLAGGGWQGVYNVHADNVNNMSGSASQQALTATGNVSDDFGPVAGASVLVKGTTIGTVTDIDGKFTLDNVKNGDVLVVSFIGYVTQEITYNGKVVHVNLKEDAKVIEEVVVVGYGTQKKANLTGAVSSVSGNEMIKRPVTNPTTMLQGQIPGLSIVQGTGQPGNESVSMRIRGQGTYSDAGSDPMILIDGVPGNLTNLNANDIESVSVLKDAASAAIYGARAANGVILVTTKNGEDNRFRLAYDVNLGTYSPTRMIELVSNSAEYMRLYNEAMRNSGIASSSNTYTDEMIALYENATDRTKYPNFDWIDAGIKSVFVQKHNLSLSGGQKGTTYNISAGYINQPGIMIGSAFEKYNFRTNLKSKLKEWVTVGSNLALERGDVQLVANGGTDDFLSLIAQAPTYGPVLPDGSGRYTYSAYPFEYHNKNQVAVVENRMMNNQVNYDVSAQLWAELTLFKDLTWYTKGAVNLTDNSSKTWRPKVPVYNFHTGESAGYLDTGEVGLTVENNRTFYTNLFSYLKYSTTVADDHNISAQAGYSQETNRYEILTGYRQVFLADLHELDAASTINQNTGGTSNQWALQSLFGRLNYDYQSRYLLELNIRYDGTSRMAQENRWGYFPSLSAGWRLSEERFLKNMEWLNNLKLRGSYGLLGNQNIGNYPYQDILAYTGSYPFDNSTLETGIAQTAFSNKNIKWEATSVFDIGLDVTVLKGLSFTYDYYKKNTTDILRSAQVSALLGLSAPTVNSGAMINYGHEISLQYAGYIDRGTLKGLNYGVGGYINTYKNEVDKFDTEEISGYYLRRNGLPYDSYYLLECIGVFQTDEEIAASPKQFSDNVQPGDLKYKDANGDNVVDNNDRMVVSGRFPDFDYSFNAFATWKGFDISAFFQGIEGKKVYVSGWAYTPFVQGAAPTTDWVTDRWTGPGTSNWLPRLTLNDNGASQNFRSSTWFLQDASYLRLKNLTIGYSLPKKLISRIKCEKIRLYFSGDNLFTVTNYKGLDPERASDGEFLNYPQNKIISFGLNVEF